jgi:ribosomal protein S18 acetylase RimI-like enzyme
MTEHVLDRPVWHSLVGPLAHLARREGSAVGFDPAISPFVGTEADGPDAWADLIRLVGPGGSGVIAGSPLPVPDGLHVPLHIVGFQMVAEGWAPEADPAFTELGVDDAADMLDLTDRTKPGPFQLRTPELGRYVGLRIDGRLVAMAGERFHPPGFTEISAVCTDPDFRGQGLAQRAMGTIGAGIVGRGETPILHVAGSNENAIRLYQRMGFVIRREIEFVAFVAPAA